MYTAMLNSMITATVSYNNTFTNKPLSTMSPELD